MAEQAEAQDSVSAACSSAQQNHREVLSTLAIKLAEIAARPGPLDTNALRIIGNRIVDMAGTVQFAGPRSGTRSTAAPPSGRQPGKPEEAFVTPDEVVDRAFRRPREPWRPKNLSPGPAKPKDSVVVVSVQRAEADPKKIVEASAGLSTATEIAALLSASLPEGQKITTAQVIEKVELDPDIIPSGGLYSIRAARRIADALGVPYPKPAPKVAPKATS